MNAKTLIAAVGNPYRHDDGIGLSIIKMLQQEKDFSANLLDSGTDGFFLLDQLNLYQRVIIIDAVDMNELPGTVKLFTPQTARMQIKADALSTHGFGLAEVLRIAEEFEIKTEIKIIAIQPENIGFGEGLSYIVKKQIPNVLHLIKMQL